MFDLDKFKESGYQVTSGQLVEAYREIKDRLHTAWESSPSAEGEGREEIYRQLRGLDSVMNQLISEIRK